MIFRQHILLIHVETCPVDGGRISRAPVFRQFVMIVAIDDIGRCFLDVLVSGMIDIQVGDLLTGYFLD